MLRHRFPSAAAAGSTPGARALPGSAPAFVAAMALATAAAAFHASPAAADEAPPRLRHDIGAYALFGRSSVQWAGAVRMPVAGAVGSEAMVSFTAPTFADGEESWVAAGWIQAGPGTRIHHAITDLPDQLRDATLHHPPEPFESPLVADADWPVAPDFDCGGADVTVSAGVSPLSLPAGRYGVVTVAQDQVLELVPGGRYELCSLRVRNGGRVRLHADNLLLVRDYVSTGVRSRLEGDGACAARWIALGRTPSPAPNAAAFDFSDGTTSSARALVQGRFFTPGRLVMGHSNDYAGRFWAMHLVGLGADVLSRTLDDCTAPTCGDGVLDPGEECDDGNNLQGDCCSAFCEVLPPGSACDDHRFCTTVDTCDDAGACTGAIDPCRGADGDGNCSESCDEETDSCTGPDSDGSACEDGLFCNGGDLCASGACASHSGAPCPGPDGDADCSESCDEASDSCTSRDPVAAPCDDGRFCTVSDACDSDGSCIGGGSPCVGPDADGDCAESCDELADACVAPDPEGSRCDDGLFCTGVDRCDGRGTCAGWSDPCADGATDGDADCSESCDEAADACTGADPGAAPCDDGLACTLDERCLAGACTPGARTACDDDNPCTDEFCAPDGSCLSQYNAAPCDDGDACTTVDRCERGTCTGSSHVDCGDGDLCSLDLCDPVDGTCRHAYAPADHCHVVGDASTRIESAWSSVDGERADRLLTTWRGDGRADPTLREELGDPALGDAWSVCFYDESAGVPDLAYRLDLSPDTLDGATWKRAWTPSQLVHKLRATDGTLQGVSQVKLVVDRDGSPTFKLKAGSNTGCGATCRDRFDPPSPVGDGRWFAMEPGMTVQWVSEAGACWSSRYEGARSNADGAFHAVSRSSAGSDARGRGDNGAAGERR